MMFVIFLKSQHIKYLIIKNFPVSMKFNVFYFLKSRVFQIILIFYSMCSITTIKINENILIQKGIAGHLNAINRENQIKKLFFDEKIVSPLKAINKKDINESILSEDQNDEDDISDETKFHNQNSDNPYFFYDGNSTRNQAENDNQDNLFNKTNKTFYELEGKILKINLDAFDENEMEIVKEFLQILNIEYSSIEEIKQDINQEKNKLKEIKNTKDLLKSNKKAARIPQNNEDIKKIKENIINNDIAKLINEQRVSPRKEHEIDQANHLLARKSILNVTTVANSKQIDKIKKKNTHTKNKKESNMHHYKYNNNKIVKSEKFYVNKKFNEQAALQIKRISGEKPKHQKNVTKNKASISINNNMPFNNSLLNKSISGIENLKKASKQTSGLEYNKTAFNKSTISEAEEFYLKNKEKFFTIVPEIVLPVQVPITNFIEKKTTEHKINKKEKTDLTKVKDDHTKNHDKLANATSAIMSSMIAKVEKLKNETKSPAIGDMSSEAQKEVKAVEHNINMRKQNKTSVNTLMSRLEESEDPAVHVEVKDSKKDQGLENFIELKNSNTNTNTNTNTNYYYNPGIENNISEELSSNSVSFFSDHIGENDSINNFVTAKKATEDSEISHLLYNKNSKNHLTQSDDVIIFPMKNSQSIFDNDKTSNVIRTNVISTAEEADKNENSSQVFYDSEKIKSHKPEEKQKDNLEMYNFEKVDSFDNHESFINQEQQQKSALPNYEMVDDFISSYEDIKTDESRIPNTPSVDSDGMIFFLEKPYSRKRN